MKSNRSEIYVAFAALLALVLLIMAGLITPAMADGGYDYYWNEEMQAYEFNTPRYGIVICTKMNVRNRASTSGKAYGQIKNGQPVKILGVTQKADFYVLDLESCGFRNVEPGTYGYAKTGLIKMDPKFISVTKLTNLYSTPWETEYNTIWYQRHKLKNGEQNGRFFLVIEEREGWYAVQAAETAPGTAFIRERDVDVECTNDYYLARYVTVWETTLLDTTTWADKQKIDRFKECRVLADYGDYYLVSFNMDTEQESRGYISKLYLAPIIN